MDVLGLSLPLVFVAGMVSFLSPCVLPLLPGYLAVVGGAGIDARARRAALLPSASFLAGFLIVFIALGASASALGAVLDDHRLLLNRVAGIFIVLMGLVLLGLVASPFAQRFAAVAGGAGERARSRGGPAALGVAFAFCWTPCIGPVLASVLAYAASGTTLREGVLLLLVYGLGLATPFLAAGLLFAGGARSPRGLQRRLGAIRVISGAVLVAMGLLIVFDRLWVVNAYAQRGLSAMGLDWWTAV